MKKLINHVTFKSFVNLTSYMN